MVESISFDLVGSFIGFGFTLVIFSYIFGDNFLFRLAVSIFVGVTAGYAAVMVWQSIIFPKLVVPLLEGDPASRTLALFPLLMGLLLLVKSINRLSGWGSAVVAFMVGAGAATIVGGAILGTLFPQIRSSIELPTAVVTSGNKSEGLVQVFNAGIILISTLSTLIFFHFGIRPKEDSFPQRSMFVTAIAKIGSVFIAITFGVIFAGVFTASLFALMDRVKSSIDVLAPLIYP